MTRSHDEDEEAQGVFRGTAGARGNPREDEPGDIPIDELEETIKSAAGKIRYLKERLKATEAEITKVLREIEDGDEKLPEER